MCKDDVKMFVKDKKRIRDSDAKYNNINNPGYNNGIWH